MPADTPDAPDAETPNEADDVGELDEPAETPFDHPLFLPALCAGLAVWFGYDGFLNPEIEAVLFNRVAFAALSVLTAWFGYRGVREMKQRSASTQREANGEEDAP